MYVKPPLSDLVQRSPRPTPVPQTFPVGSAPSLADGSVEPINLGGIPDDSDPNNLPLDDPSTLAASDGGYDDPTTHTVQDQLPSETPTSTLPSETTQSLASQSSSTASPSTTSSDPSHHSSFKLVYLTPLFVLMGIFLLFSVGGKIWGKIWHKREKEIRRAEKRARRAANKEKIDEMNRIKQGWIDGGHGERRSSAENWLKDEVDRYNGNVDGSAGNYNGNGVNGERYQGVFGNGSDSDDHSSDEDGNERNRGSNHLTLKLGLGGRSKKQKNKYATTRTRNGKWENSIQSNGWMSRFKMGIHNLGDDDDDRGDYTNPTEEGRVGVGGADGLQRKPTLRASLRGTWNRIKKSIAVSDDK